VSFDPGATRADFPILATSVHGNALTYLDNAASAQKPLVVLDRMRRFMLSEYSNVHRGIHHLANVATEAYEGAREILRRFLNAAHREEIIFTKSVTDAINLVASSLGQRLVPGDEVIVSVMEHHSNIIPWHFLRERRGINLKWVPVSEQGSFLFDEFLKLLTPGTKIVALTHMSNVLGTVPPVRNIIRAAHEVGALVLLDGAQAAVHCPVDVQDLDVDFYGVTGHKLYGPTGVGVLYGKLNLLKDMPPFLGGGEMVKEMSLGEAIYEDPPYRFEAGTPPIVEAVGLGAAVSYLEGLGRDEVFAHESEIFAYAYDALKDIPGLRIYGQAENKGAIISFNLSGTNAYDVAAILDRCGVAVRAGTHCAQPLLTFFDTKATCRASFALYNTRDEVDRLVDAVLKARSLLN